MQFKQGSRAASLVVGAFLALGSSVAMAAAAPYAMVTFSFERSAPTVASVPVMSDWVALAMALLVAIGGALALRRKAPRSLAAALFASALALGGWGGDPIMRSAYASVNEQATSIQFEIGSLPVTDGIVWTASMTPSSLFDVTGGQPLENIFVADGSRSPSFISQAFGGSYDDVGTAGLGFLGFGSGDGTVFGSSTFAALFNRTGYTMMIDDIQGFDSGGVPFGLQGVFGAPTLGRAPLTKASPAPITTICQAGVRIPAGGSCSIGLVDRTPRT
ncbi:hypothetical protein G7048_21285 [Diaphorobacter sp. HDW4B]|uniref:hypothetical protein n=1 Tax=Diaphorobacter sp. HDW4B TaxID=2714925 RepID=UPI00140A6F18|nr:hypothetical protein [Diaphorobacter sp. HDW4B]QIL72661.1 hypothetical protein G7048_21285 [Diaphorobacter sp. HDW4B]